MIHEDSPEAVGREIMELSRNELLVNFRFLDRALLNLELRQSSDVSILTDGRAILYDPWFVRRRWRMDPNSLTRGILHTVLHLVLRHNLVGAEVEPRLWSLACDISVEHLISDLPGGFLRTASEAEEKAVFEELEKTFGTELTPERVLDRLEEENLPDERLEELALLFWGDSHALWYSSEKGNVSEDVVLRWEEISKRMQVELELLDREKSSLLASRLRRINRARRDYDGLLRRFARETEVLKLSQEEFDNNYYCYGLQLYGDVPIVEPLEYSQGRRIREFVIAIDTSGSVRTKVAEEFLAHTYSVLSTGDCFDEHARVRILQCDDRIRHEALITSKREMQEYLEGMEIYGRGETDFRPVFAHVEQMRMNGEIQDLRGLIYFTDGEGIFPGAPTDYDTAFIIHRDRQYAPVPVPAWAITVEMEDEDIIHGKF